MVLNSGRLEVGAYVAELVPGGNASEDGTIAVRIRVNAFIRDNE
jgi:hypothetical protein